MFRISFTFLTLLTTFFWGSYASGWRIYTFDELSILLYTPYYQQPDRDKAFKVSGYNKSTTGLDRTWADQCAFILKYKNQWHPQILAFSPPLNASIIYNEIDDEFLFETGGATNFFRPYQRLFIFKNAIFTSKQISLPGLINNGPAPRQTIVKLRIRAIHPERQSEEIIEVYGYIANIFGRYLYQYLLTPEQKEEAWRIKEGKPVEIVFSTNSFYQAHLLPEGHQWSE